MGKRLDPEPFRLARDGCRKDTLIFLKPMSKSHKAYSERGDVFV